MDVDMLKSSAAGDHHHHHHFHPDMMTMMMMQMEKPPHDQQFSCDPLPISLQDIDFCGGSSSMIFNNLPQINVASSVSQPNVSVSNFMTPTSVSMEKRNNSMAAMREMIFRIAAMQPIHIDPESVKPPKRRNVKISKDPQSVAARHRRERISERIRILQRLVPGGTKMDTASMLDEAIHYVKFLKKQVQTLQQAGANNTNTPIGVGFQGTQLGNPNYSDFIKASQMLGAPMHMLR